MTILLAEDEPQTAQLIELKLKQAGFSVVHATDGEKALALVGPTQPVLVLLDGIMPVMDGFEVLRRLKEDPRTRHIPVIMLTARARQRHRHWPRTRRGGLHDQALQPLRTRRPRAQGARPGSGQGSGCSSALSGCLRNRIKIRIMSKRGKRPRPPARKFDPNPAPPNPRR